MNNMYSLARVANPTYPVVWPAVIENPLDVPYTNEPVGIKCFFFPGECPTALHLKVKNAAGAYVDFQWEADVHPFSESDLGTWPDGSLRQGILWVNVPTLAANESQTWSVELYGVAQAYSPVQLVVHTVTDASNEKFETAGVTLNFRDTSAWMPQSMIDRATSQELLATATGLTVRNRFTAAGGELLSSTGANLTGLAKSRVKSAAVGYGVVFQEFEGSWTWVAGPQTTRVRTRLWANGRVTIQALTTATGSATSESKSLILNISSNNTGIVTNIGDNEKGRKLWEYAASRFVCGFRYLTTDYEVKTTETHSTNWSTTVAANRMFGGWTGTTTIAAGAYWFQQCFLAIYAVGDVENEWLRGMNPLYTTLGRWGIENCRLYLRGFVNRYIKSYLPIVNDNDKRGVEAMCRILEAKLDRTVYTASAALAKFAQYTTSVAITPSSAASWHSVWNAGQGMNFIAKNGESLFMIYQWAIELGDTATAATALTYITALADFVLLAETTSGGDGQMRLDGAGLDNYNAEASAMALLAQALKLIPTAAWAACYARIAARYISGNFAGGTRRCYRLQTYGGLPHDCVKAPQSTYDSYQNYEIARAHQLFPVTGGIPNSYQYLQEITNASMQALDKQYQGQVVRRGLTNTTLHAVFQLAQKNTISSWNALALICLQADKQLIFKNGQQHPQNGFTGTDVTLLNVMGDIRSAIETIWQNL